MKFLHTADWHIGKKLHNFDLKYEEDDAFKQIERIAAHREKISIYNLEALDFIENIILNKRKTFTFFDPPYYSKGPGLYKNFYSHGIQILISLYVIGHYVPNANSNIARCFLYSADTPDRIRNKAYDRNNILRFLIHLWCSSNRIHTLP